MVTKNTGQYIQFMKFDVDPSGNVFVALMDVLFDLSDYFYLVIRNEIDGIERAIKVIEQLSGYRIAERDQRSWGGTLLGYGATPATVFYYKSCEYTKKLFLSNSNSLYEWILPSKPEDPSFVRDGKYLMISTTHERLGFLNYAHPVLRERMCGVLNLPMEPCEVLEHNQYVADNCRVFDV